MVNIPDSHDDPFPKSGLVKQYEPFIRKTVRVYCTKYPASDRWDILREAIFLALRAEEEFDASRGYDFSTLLRSYLGGLARFESPSAGYSQTSAGPRQKPKARKRWGRR